MVETANSFVLLCEEHKKRSAKDKEHAAAVQAQRALLQKLAAELTPRRRAVVAQAWLGLGLGLGFLTLTLTLSLTLIRWATTCSRPRWSSSASR